MHIGLEHTSLTQALFIKIYCHTYDFSLVCDELITLFFRLFSLFKGTLNTDNRYELDDENQEE